MNSTCWCLPPDTGWVRGTMFFLKASVSSFTPHLFFCRRFAITYLIFNFGPELLIIISQCYVSEGFSPASWRQEAFGVSSWHSEGTGAYTVIYSGLICKRFLAPKQRVFSLYRGEKCKDTVARVQHSVGFEFSSPVWSFTWTLHALYYAGKRLKLESG